MNVFKQISDIPKERLYLFLIGIFLLLIGTQVPYISTIFPPLVVVMLAYLLLHIIFRVTAKVSIILGCLALLSSLPWLLVESRIKAEPLGILAFFFFALGFLQAARKLGSSR